MKIGLCQFSQETNTFSPARLSFRDIFPKGFRDPETPGLRSTDLSSYPYEKIRRPVFPLEKEGKFPAAEVTSCRRKGIYTVKDGLLEDILKKGKIQ